MTGTGDPLPGVVDVLVVGGGPAGSLAALLAARRGLSTVLVERDAFPRWKVCGACLNAAGRAVLDDAGLSSILTGAPRLEELAVSGWGRRATVPVFGSVALRRSVLDAGLLEAARRAGVAVVRGTVTGSGEVVSRGTLRRVPVRRAGSGAGAGEGDPAGVSTVAARVVVVAAGLAGLRGPEGPGTPQVAGDSRIGVGAAFPAGVGGYAPGTVHMVAGDAGYVGLVRTEDGGLNVAGALDPAFVRDRGGPGGAVAAHLAAAGAPGLPDDPAEGWRGTPPLTRHAPAVAGPRILLVGDAAGYVEPFTGEGMAWALAGARALSSLLPGAVEAWSPSVEEAWTRSHRRNVVRRHRVCRGVAWLSRRPGLARATLGVLSRWPDLARPLSRRTARPASEPLPTFQGHPS